MKRTATKRRPISPASPAQRDAIRDRACIVSGSSEAVDPAHLCARGRGGCDDPLCVVPLRRDKHMLFDRGELDILGDLIAAGLVEEIAHALVHYRGDMPGLLERLTGVRWAPRDGGS